MATAAVRSATNRDSVLARLEADTGLVIKVIDAEFIHGVVWAAIDRQWRTGDSDRDGIRDRAVGFCLRGLGVASDAIAQ